MAVASCQAIALYLLPAMPTFLDAYDKYILSILFVPRCLIALDEGVSTHDLLVELGLAVGFC